LNRRDALQRVTFILGGAVSFATATAIMSGCKSSTDNATGIDGQIGSFVLKPDQKSLLSQLAEVIIPKTDTPGATEAKVADFIEVMMNDCYTKEQQDHFYKGFELAEAEAKKLGGSFSSLDASKKIEVMKILKNASELESKANDEKAKQIDTESGLVKENLKKKDEKEVPVPFFKLLKELTVFGYFSSEIGAKSNLNYVAVPGKFQGCIPATASTKPYAL
jgi:hypothetical protein